MAKIQVPVSHGRYVDEPPIAKFLFSDKRMGVVWLVVRLYVAYQWFNAGLHKVQDATWLNGEALKAFWARIVQVPATGSPPISNEFPFYREFIQGMLNAKSYTWFGPLVAYGELLIGIALFLGAFTGIAAFFGAFMNWNFIMAGSASTNGMLLVLAMLLALAWKISGFIGADYFLLRWVGVPWKGEEAKPKESVAPAAGQ